MSNVRNIRLYTEIYPQRPYPNEKYDKFSDIKEESEINSLQDEFVKLFTIVVNADTKARNQNSTLLQLNKKLEDREITQYKEYLAKIDMECFQGIYTINLTLLKRNFLMLDGALEDIDRDARTDSTALKRLLKQLENRDDKEQILQEVSSTIQKQDENRDPLPQLAAVRTQFLEAMKDPNRGEAQKLELEKEREFWNNSFKKLKNLEITIQ